MALADEKRDTQRFEGTVRTRANSQGTGRPTCAGNGEELGERLRSVAGDRETPRDQSLRRKKGNGPPQCS